MTPSLSIPLEGFVGQNYLLLFDSHGTVLYKNEKCDLINGINKAVNSVFDLISKAEIPQLQQTISTLISKPGSSASYLFTMDGTFDSETFFDARFYSFFNDGHIHILMLADDITEKVRLSNRMAFGFENSSDVIYELDILKRRYNYVNPSCLELFEITTGQAMQLKPGELETKIHVEDYQAVHDHFSRICKQPGTGKRNFFIRYRFYHSVKGLKWVIDRHTVFYNNQSQPYLLIGNIRDITELQLSYEIIARNEKMFKSIVDNSIDIISMLDRNGVIQFVSPSIEPILGYKPEEIINKHPFEFMDPSMHSEVEKTMQKLLAHPGQVIESEMYFKYASGRDVYLKSKLSIIWTSRIFKPYWVQLRI